MTAIVGLVHKRKVYIGGDSAGVAGLSLSVRKDQKVFQVGDFIIGCCGSFRMAQILRFSFNPPTIKEDQDVYEYMVRDFVPAVRAALSQGHWLENKDGRDEAGHFLVGFRGRLFAIDSDLHVGENVAAYDAIGCGEDLCKGALFATKGQPPIKRIEKALSAAEEHSAGVRGPFTVFVQ